jgi:ABC-2 type transport system permease protein
MSGQPFAGPSSPAAPKAIRGPAALGGGARRFRELLWLMALTEFRKSYFDTVLGYVWSLFRPLIFFAVLLLVFTRIIRFGNEVPNYPVMLLFNLVLFSFFQETTGLAVESVVGREAIVRKTHFPRLVIPLSITITGLLNLAPSLLVAFGFILVYGVDPTWTWLLLPVIVALLFAFTCAVSIALSALFVRFRDVGIIWGVVALVLLYCTPIIYPIQFIPENLEPLFFVNPLVPIFEQARVWIIDPSAPTAVEAAGGVAGLLPALAVFVFVCVFAWWIFNREAPNIAEAL